MLLSSALTAVLVAAASSAVPAQTTPAPRAPSAARTARAAIFPLNMAYREIGRAEQAGASGHFIDAARAHYRGAIDRYGRNDAAGAGGEARLAMDLARAAMDERPRVKPAGPKDIPAPPTMAPRTTAMGGPGAMGAPGGMPGMRGGPMMMHGPMGEMGGGRHHFGGMRHHEGFDATRLAELLKIETGAEAHQIAQAAVDANAAAQRAALGGNVEEAARQSRVSGDLLTAVHDLAVINHPELGRRAPGPTIRILRSGTPGAPGPA
jgi:hypothetical protein